MQKAYLLITNETKDADNFKPRCDASRERKKKKLAFIGPKTESNSFGYKGWNIITVNM